MGRRGSGEAFRALAEELEPEAVSGWLAAEGWVLDFREDGVREIWELPGRRARVMVPLARDFADFAARFGDLFTMLGAVYGWTAPDLAERIRR